MGISQAKTNCTGSLSSLETIRDDILISGVECKLQNVTIEGSVFIINSGSLATSGDVFISGGLHARDVFIVDLGPGTHISGDVTVENSAAPVFIRANSSIGALHINGGYGAYIEGSIASLYAYQTQTISIESGTVRSGGVFLQKVDVRVVIRGDISGGITLDDCSADSYLGGNIRGTLKVRGHSGRFFISGAQLSDSKIEIEDHTTQKVLEILDSKAAAIVLKHTGSFYLRNVTVNEDVNAEVYDNSESIISFSKIGGKAIVAGGRQLRFYNNELTEKSTVRVSRFGKYGDVNISGNKMYSALIHECGGPILFSNNTVQYAEFNKNNGVTSIVNNTMSFISCSDNVPPPSGSGNTVSGLSKEQCSTI